jgi:hypothetical protein
MVMGSAFLSSEVRGASWVTGHQVG